MTGATRLKASQPGQAGGEGGAHTTVKVSQIHKYAVTDIQNTNTNTDITYVGRCRLCIAESNINSRHQNMEEVNFWITTKHKNVHKVDEAVQTGEQKRLNTMIKD